MATWRNIFSYATLLCRSKGAAASLWLVAYATAGLQQQTLKTSVDEEDVILGLDAELYREEYALLNDDLGLQKNVQPVGYPLHCVQLVRSFYWYEGS